METLNRQAVRELIKALEFRTETIKGKDPTLTRQLFNKLKEHVEMLYGVIEALDEIADTLGYLQENESR